MFKIGEGNDVLNRIGCSRTKKDVLKQKRMFQNRKECSKTE